LSHITRDFAIAALQQRQGAMDTHWLAAKLTSRVLKSAGETLVPEAESFENESLFAEEAARESRLNQLAYLTKARSAWNQNVGIFREAKRRAPCSINSTDQV
jgi:hypothetical protein